MPDQVQPAKFRHVSSDKLASRRLAFKPFSLVLVARGLCITLCQQLIQGIAGPWTRFHDQTSVLNRKTDLRSWAQIQYFKHNRRYGQHDRAADLAQIGCMKVCPASDCPRTLREPPTLRRLVV